jgi:hypothetical protein
LKISSPLPATTSCGSVQQGLSVAGGALGLFQLGLATDKRYSLGCWMSDWQNFIKFARFALAVSLIPFVQSCDGQVGVTQTFGFPFPFVSHIAGSAELNFFVTSSLIINIFFFAGLAFFLTHYKPSLIRHLNSLWVLVVVLVFAALCYFGNAVIYTVYAFVSIRTHALFGVSSIYAHELDIFARCLFLVVLAVTVSAVGAAQSVKNAKK